MVACAGAGGPGGPSGPGTLPPDAPAPPKDVSIRSDKAPTAIAPPRRANAEQSAPETKTLGPAQDVAAPAPDATAGPLPPAGSTAQGSRVSEASPVSDGQPAFNPATDRRTPPAEFRSGAVAEPKPD